MKGFSRIYPIGWCGQRIYCRRREHWIGLSNGTGLGPGGLCSGTFGSGGHGTPILKGTS